MKRVAFLALLVLALPMAVWADDINVVNQLGGVSLSTSGIISANSPMTGYNGLVGPGGAGSLGYVTFGTGALLSGSLSTGGTFSATGSWFDIFSRSKYGQPSGSIFTGAFVGPISWILTSTPGKPNLTFILTGQIEGQLYTGHEITGTTTQYLYASQGSNSGNIKFGHTSFASSPEPGTLGLLGTGVLGMAGMIRRRKSS